MTALRRLITTLLATVTALALMTAAAAVPARADSRSDDLAKAIAAIAALALIANAIDDKDEPKVKPQPGYPVVRPHRPPVHVEPLLPAACALRISGLRGEKTAYSQDCLRSYGLHLRLPRHCAHEVRINGHRDRVYAKKCLAKAGIYAEGNRHDRYWED